MKRIILRALPAVPVLFWLFRSYPAHVFFFAVGLLATAVYFVARYVRPWYKERTTKEPVPPYLVHKYISLISLLSLIAGAAFYIIFSIQPGPPAPLHGHANQVNIVAFNSAADRLASGGVDGSIRLWNVPENGIIGSFPGKDETLYAKYGDLYTSIAYSPDGNLIAFGSTDQTIRVWDMKKNLVLYQLTGHTGPVNALAFSPDGKWLASGGEDKIVRLWRVGDGTLARKLEGNHTKGVTSLAFNGAGDYLASGSIDTTAGLWQVSNGALLRKFEGLTEPVLGVAFGRDPTFIKDKETLLAVSAKGILRRWPVDDPKNYREMFKERASDITVVAFSRDGIYMASADPEKSIKIWRTVPVPSNLPTPIVTPNIPVTPTPPYAPKSTLKKQNEIVRSLAFDPDGKILAYAGKDNQIHTWNVPDGLALKDFDQGIEVNAVTFSPDGNSIAAASIDKTVRVLDKNEGKELIRYEGFSRDIRQLAFSQDGANLVSVSRDGYIRNWRIKDSALIYERKAEPNQITSLALRPTEGKVLATGLVTGTFQIWRLDGGEPNAIQAHTRPVTSLAFTPNGSLIASASIDEPIRIWTGDGKPVSSLSGQKGEIIDLVFSPDSKTLASASSDKTVVLTSFLDTTGITRTNTITITGMPVAATTMVFSQDGTMLATGGGDNVVRLWKVADATEVDKLSGFEQPVKSLGITKDNAIVAAANVPEGSDIRVWTVGDLKGIRDRFSTYSLRKGLLGSEAASIFLAYVLGLALATGIVLLPVWLISGMAAKVMWPLYPGFEFDQTRRAIFSTHLGINKIEQKVSKEKIETLRPAAGELARFGGPGVLIVEEGNAAILAQSGKISRVVGRGITYLKPFENVNMAVFLGTRAERVKVEGLLSRDQMQIESIEIAVYHRVKKGVPDTDVDSRFPFDSGVLLNQVWNPTALDWRGSVESIARTTLYDLIAQKDFQDLVTAAGEVREELCIALRQGIQKPILARGVQISAVVINEIKVPEQVLQELQERGLGQVRQEVRILEAETERDVIARQGEGKAYALDRIEKIKARIRQALIQQLANPFQGGTPIRDADIAVSFISAVERLTATLVREDVDARHYIDLLEKVIESGGAKSFLFGDSSSFMGADERPRPE